MKNVLKKIELHFAAAGLAEGDRDQARRFMADNSDGFKGAILPNIKRQIEKLETGFAVAGLAEGDPELARDYIRYSTPNSTKSPWMEQLVNKTKSLINSFERNMAAGALTEGSLEMARDYLKVKDQELNPSKAKNQEGIPFNNFLETIGLQGVRVQYGVVVT